MNRWFRVYEDLLDDPKVQRLPGDLFKMLLNVWCLTSRNEGVLPPIADVAFALRENEGICANALNELQKCGLIDDDDGTLRPHNWNGRQFRSNVSTKRVQAFRKRKRNANETFHETPPDSDSETDSESERGVASATPSRARATPRVLVNKSKDWPADYREQFRAVYPRNEDMIRGLEALEATKRSGEVTWKFLITRIREMARKVPADRQQLAKNYLEQKRFLDKYPETKNGRNHEPTTAEIAAQRALELEALEREGAVGGAPDAIGGDEVGGDHARPISRIERA